jgi:hypothetical protein
MNLPTKKIMTTKYTPGPWVSWNSLPHGKSSEISGPTAAASCTARYAIDKDGWARYCVIAGPNYKSPALAFGDTQEEANANAVLIAAGPEMIELLEKLTSRHGPVLQEDVNRAREIIAKVKNTQK